MEKLISDLLFPEGGWGVTAACPFSALSAVAMAPRIARSCAGPGTMPSACARRVNQRPSGSADYLRVPVRASLQQLLLLADKKELFNYLQCLHWIDTCVLHLSGWGHFSIVPVLSRIPNVELLCGRWASWALISCWGAWLGLGLPESLGQNSADGQMWPAAAGRGAVPESSPAPLRAVGLGKGQLLGLLGCG